jgi:hypothetical protein
MLLSKWRNVSLIPTTGFFPAAGQRSCLELTSFDRRENFTLDVTRAQIKLTKATY